MAGQGFKPWKASADGFTDRCREEPATSVSAGITKRPQLLHYSWALGYRNGLARMSSFRETSPVQEKPSPVARIASWRQGFGIVELRGVSAR